MNNYDLKSGWDLQTVKISYMKSEYKLTTEVVIQGNLKGMELLKSAIPIHVDQLFIDSDNPVVTLSFTDKKGNIKNIDLIPNEENGSLENQLNNMCIELKVLNQVPEDLFYKKPSKINKEY